MRVKFLSPYDYRPSHYKGRVVIVYPHGWRGHVKRECGEAAIREGKAVSDDRDGPAQGTHPVREKNRDG